MKTYEGVMTIKWYENDRGGDRRPLTIDTIGRSALKVELNHIRRDFITKDKANSVTFDMDERI